MSRSPSEQNEPYYGLTPFMEIAARLRQETTLSLKCIAPWVGLGTSKSANARLHNGCAPPAANNLTLTRPPTEQNEPYYGLTPFMRQYKAKALGFWHQSEGVRQERKTDL